MLADRDFRSAVSERVAAIWYKRRSFYGRDGRQAAQKSHYRLADEPSPLIEVSCSKCEWKGAFSRVQLLAMYGAEFPLPTLLNHLAMPTARPDHSGSYPECLK